MNILFIGPYRQTDAWGNMSKSLIKTLSKIQDYSLTIRPIFLSGETSGPVDADIIKYESNKKRQYDILIQHMLPNYMVYDSSFKQVIGITGFETLGCKIWDNSLDLLDKIFVTTEAERKGISKELQSKTYSIGVANEQAIESKDKIKKLNNTIISIPLDPPGEIGQDCIKLNFNINKNSQLVIDGIDLRNNSEITKQNLGEIR